MKDMNIKIGGRKAEVNKIRQANKAAAVGRLMLGEITDWNEFFKADTVDLERLPRRQLKSGAGDAKKRMSKEIKHFCSQNFENMTESKLNLLYELVKAKRGVEIDLKTFENTYSKIKPKVLKGYPLHCTIVISLWGLQFKFPEDYLSKDVCIAITTAVESYNELEKYQKSSHRNIRSNRNVLSNIMRKKTHASRSCVLGCFNLTEAYLNGIVWNFVQDELAFNALSKRKQNLITDIGQTKLRDKIIKYPEIVTGRHLWDGSNETVQAFLEILKPFRDSLVHPSPFSAPEKFGGYDKLSHFYRIDIDIAVFVAQITSLMISQIHQHINMLDDGQPVWLNELTALLEKTLEFADDGEPHWRQSHTPLFPFLKGLT